MDSRKKISTTVYITHEQNNALKLLNQKTKVPIAEYIREGIDMVLELHKHLLPGQMMLLQEDEVPDPGSAHNQAQGPLRPRTRPLDN